MITKAFVYQLLDLVRFSYALPIAAFLLAGVRAKQRPSTIQVLLFAIVLTSLATDILGAVMANSLHRNNLVLSHLYTLVEFILLYLLYQEAISWPRQSLWPIFFFIAIVVGDATVWNSLDNPNYVPRGIASIIFVGLALWYYSFQLGLFQEIEKESHPAGIRTPMYWINAAVLIYFAGSFFFVLFSIFFLELTDYALVVFALHGGLMILKHILFVPALWLPHQK